MFWPPVTSKNDFSIYRRTCSDNFQPDHDQTPQLKIHEVLSHQATTRDKSIDRSFWCQAAQRATCNFLMPHSTIAEDAEVLQIIPTFLYILLGWWIQLFTVIVYGYLGRCPIVQTYHLKDGMVQFLWYKTVIKARVSVEQCCWLHTVVTVVNLDRNLKIFQVSLSHMTIQ